MNNSFVARKIFNSIAKAYDIFLSLSTLGFINYLQNKLIKNTPLIDNILDIGTGTGEILKKIDKKYKNKILLGVDISENMLKKAKSKVKNAFFIKADAENLPIKDKCIDNIFYSLTFRHLYTENQIKQLKRILKDKGTISILDLNRSKLLILLFGKIFKPFTKLLFSNEEYNYFLESLKGAKTLPELEKEFHVEGFQTVYKDQYFFGIVIIVIFRKDI